MDIIRIHKGQPGYPASLRMYFSDKAPEEITTIGNFEIMQNKTLAIFCSLKCPGKIILKTYEYVRNLRESNITVIGGFHSPMEQECLNILLKGTASIILCPARNINGIRIKKEYRKLIEDGRFLILSHFSENNNRLSSGRAEKRNNFVAALADEMFIPYAARGSKTESLCEEWIKKGKNVMTFDIEYNNHLIKLGASIIDTL